MLCLHAGWPRTGTSTLQAALARHSSPLAAAGVVYPERWKVERLESHHGLNDLLAVSRQSGDAFEDFKRFLVSQGDRDVLLSAEGMTGWARSSEKREGFLELIAAAREVAPTRCVWTLRRFDDTYASMYLLLLALGRDCPPPDEYLAEIRFQDPLFEGMRQVEEATDGNVVYVKYDPLGGHNRRLLDAFEVPDAVGVAIREELQRGPDPRSSLSHKEAVAFANVEALSAARRHDIGPYVEFFEHAEIEESMSPGLDPGVIDETDLTQLVAHLERGMNADG
ncbi:MAG TPA: hypothetical protein VF085_09915 [Solirubrobacterales bacterium]